MKKIFLIITIVFVGLATDIKAQFVTIDPAHIATSIANTTSEIVQTSSTVANVIRNFEEVRKVYNQGKEYYDKLKAVHGLIKDAKKVRDAILIVGEIGDIYVNSYQKMLADPNFRYEELTAIFSVYTVLLRDGADMLTEMKEVVNVNGLSMTDHERMEIIDRVYGRLKNHRNLVSYFTNKNLSVSYERAVKANETQRFLELYGTADEKYW
jgi:hypothetical protein